MYVNILALEDDSGINRVKKHHSHQHKRAKVVTAAVKKLLPCCAPKGI